MFSSKKSYQIPKFKDKSSTSTYKSLMNSIDELEEFHQKGVITKKN